MRIAYLILAHNNPRLLKRTVERLSGGDSAFFIHIDQKSDGRAFSGIGGDNVVLSEERIPVHWSEFSVVESVLLLVRQALRTPCNFDYLVLLSGSDYPLRSANYIRLFLQESAGQQFMSIERMPNPAAGVPISRINRLWIQSDQPILRFAVRMLAKVGLAQRDYRKHLGSLEPYAGDMWWALTREACQYVIDFIAENRHVQRYFRDTVAPDEMFFHTILGNSPFASQLRRNFHYADWSACGPHPAMINAGHLAMFEAQQAVCLDDVYGRGEALFARKFCDERLDLVQRIDDMIARKEQTSVARTHPAI